MADITILGFAGSLRRESYNRALLDTAAEIAPDGMHIEIFDLAPIPFYNADVEAEGDPEASGSSSPGPTITSRSTSVLPSKAAREVRTSCASAGDRSPTTTVRTFVHARHRKSSSVRSPTATWSPRARHRSRSASSPRTIRTWSSCEISRVARTSASSGARPVSNTLMAGA